MDRQQGRCAPVREVRLRGRRHSASVRAARRRVRRCLLHGSAEPELGQDLIGVLAELWHGAGGSGDPGDIEWMVQRSNRSNRTWHVEPATARCQLWVLNHLLNVIYAAEG